ncbi:MAG: hypothetical protein RSF73_09900 [Ruthenibacterium sp.]
MPETYKIWRTSDCNGTPYHIMRNWPADGTAKTNTQYPIYDLATITKDIATQRAHDLGFKVYP